MAVVIALTIVVCLLSSSHIIKQLLIMIDTLHFFTIITFIMIVVIMFTTILVFNENLKLIINSVKKSIDVNVKEQQSSFASKISIVVCGQPLIFCLQYLQQMQHCHKFLIILYKY
jgi:hypothetical protein